MSDDEIKGYTELNWRTLIKRATDKFDDHLNSKKSDLFDESYVRELHDKSNKIDSLYFKLSIAYFILLFSLFYSLGKPNAEFQFLGLSVKNLYEARGVIIVFLAILGPINSILHLQSAYLTELGKVALKHITSNDDFYYYKYKYYWDVFDLMRRENFSHFPHLISKVTILVFSLSVVLMLLIFSAISVFAIVVIMHDLVAHPISETYLNGVVIAALGVSLFFQISFRLMSLPLPEKQYNLERLKRLKKEDLEAYNQVATKLHAKTKRNQFRANTGIYIFLYTITLLLFTYDYTSHQLVYSYNNFPVIVVLLVAGNYISHKTVSQFSFYMSKNYFEKYSDGSGDEDLKMFGKLSRKLQALKILTPLSISFLMGLIMFRYFSGQ